MSGGQAGPDDGTSGGSSGYDDSYAVEIIEMSLEMFNCILAAIRQSTRCDLRHFHFLDFQFAPR